MKVYESLTVKNFAADEPIDVTALVELDTDDTRCIYFIGPRNGGLELKMGRKEVTVITPQSPLGRNIMGKKAGQRWTTKLGGSSVKYHIVSVH
jgi:transcription elongation GreA/GreB family factor